MKKQIKADSESNGTSGSRNETNKTTSETKVKKTLLSSCYKRK